MGASAARGDARRAPAPPSHALAQQARLQRRRDGADARQLHAARADAPADLRLRAARRAPRADGEPVRQLRPSSPPAPARRWNARGGVQTRGVTWARTRTELS